MQKREGKRTQRRCAAALDLIWSGWWVHDGALVFKWMGYAIFRWMCSLTFDRRESCSGTSFPSEKSSLARSMATESRFALGGFAGFPFKWDGFAGFLFKWDGLFWVWDFFCLDWLCCIFGLIWYYEVFWIWWYCWVWENGDFENFNFWVCVLRSGFVFLFKTHIDLNSCNF